MTDGRESAIGASEPKFWVGAGFLLLPGNDPSTEILASGLSPKLLKYRPTDMHAGKDRGKVMDGRPSARPPKARQFRVNFFSLSLHVSVFVGEFMQPSPRLFLTRLNLPMPT